MVTGRVGEDEAGSREPTAEARGPERPGEAAGAPWIRWARGRGPRLALTAALLAGLAWVLPWAEVAAALASASPGVVLATLVGLAAAHVVAATKWRLLLRAAGVEMGWLDAARSHGAGLASNLFLPSMAGGDVVRAGVAARGRAAAAPVAVAAVADRMADVTALVVLAGLGALSAPSARGGAATTALVVAVGVLVTGLAVALPLSLALDTSRLPVRFAGVASRLQGAARSTVRRPGLAAAGLALSLATQGAILMLNVVLGRDVGVAAPISVWTLAWPLTKLTESLPVSLGGLGVREVALAAYLAPFGVEPSRAVAQSLLWQAVRVGLGLLGAAVALWLPGTRQTPGTEAGS